MSVGMVKPLSKGALADLSGSKSDTKRNTNLHHSPTSSFDCNASISEYQNNLEINLKQYGKISPGLNEDEVAEETDQHNYLMSFEADSNYNSNIIHLKDPNELIEVMADTPLKPEDELLSKHNLALTNNSPRVMSRITNKHKRK